MFKLSKFTIYKLLPLVILYLLLIISFIGRSDYEYLIVLIAAIPLIAYIFTEDSKLKKYLQYVLYLLAAGIIAYWVFWSYGLIWGMFNGYFSFPWQPCFFSGCHGENTWEIFIESAIFQVDLKILFYLGIIYLAIKNKNRIKG